MATLGSGADIDTNVHCGIRTGVRTGVGLADVAYPLTLAEITAFLGFTPDYAWNLQQTTVPYTPVSGAANYDFTEGVAGCTYNTATPLAGRVSIKHDSAGTHRVIISDTGHPTVGAGSFMVCLLMYNASNTGANRTGLIKFSSPAGWYLNRRATNAWQWNIGDSVADGSTALAVTAAVDKFDCLQAVVCGVDRATETAFLHVKAGGVMASVTGDSTGVATLDTVGQHRSGNGASPPWQPIAYYLCAGDTGYYAASADICARML